MKSNQSRVREDGGTEGAKATDKRRWNEKGETSLAVRCVIGLAEETWSRDRCVDDARTAKRGDRGQKNGSDSRVGGRVQLVCRKARTPALHPPAVSQCTLPCAPPPMYPVYSARATRLDDESLSSLPSSLSVSLSLDDSVLLCFSLSRALF